MVSGQLAMNFGGTPPAQDINRVYAEIAHIIPFSTWGNLRFHRWVEFFAEIPRADIRMSAINDYRNLIMLKRDLHSDMDKGMSWGIRWDQTTDTYTLER